MVTSYGRFFGCVDAPIPSSIGFPFETLHPINVSSIYTYIYIYIYKYGVLAAGALEQFLYKFPVSGDPNLHVDKLFIFEIQY